MESLWKISLHCVKLKLQQAADGSECFLLCVCFVFVFFCWWWRTCDTPRSHLQRLNAQQQQLWLLKTFQTEPSDSHWIRKAKAKQINGSLLRTSYKRQQKKHQEKNSDRKNFAIIQCCSCCCCCCSFYCCCCRRRCWSFNILSVRTKSQTHFSESLVCDCAKGQWGTLACCCGCCF